MLSHEYVAGFFDGERCIRLVANKADSGFGIHVFISNTYKPILDQLKEQYGGNVTPKAAATKNHRTCYVWRISNRPEALAFLRIVEPYLVEKRAQAILGIEFCHLPCKKNQFTTIPDFVRARQHAIKDKLSELKRRDYAIQP